MKHVNDILLFSPCVQLDARPDFERWNWHPLSYQMDENASQLHHKQQISETLMYNPLGKIQPANNQLEPLSTRIFASTVMINFNLLNVSVKTRYTAQNQMNGS